MWIVVLGLGGRHCNMPTAAGCCHSHGAAVPANQRALAMVPATAITLMTPDNQQHPRGLNEICLQSRFFNWQKDCCGLLPSHHQSSPVSSQPSCPVMPQPSSPSSPSSNSKCCRHSPCITCSRGSTQHVTCVNTNAKAAMQQLVGLLVCAAMTSVVHSSTCM